MRFLCFLFVVFIFSASCFAQQVRPASSAEIYREIAQLQHLTRVLYIAAHPDDENTRLLAWLVNDRHINTAYLSLTRGDGGQNILGKEQGAALGLIRTNELLAARKIDGAGQYFTRAVDFGYSKNFTETFKHWDEDVLTEDVVRIIRQFRPDVIICRFPPNEQAGHGQHAASAIIAAKAFEKCGDKTYKTGNLKPWQPERLLWNTYRFGDRNTTSEDQFKVAVGNFAPTLGMGYGELAGISRSIHRSQGAGTPSVPGVQQEYFKLVSGSKPERSFFDGIDVSWKRVNRPEIGDEIEEVLKGFDYNHPNRSLPALLHLREEIATVKKSFWRAEKIAALDKIILDAAGLMIELTTKTPEATDGETLPFTAKFIARSGRTPVKIEEINYQGNALQQPKTMLKNDSLYTADFSLKIPDDAAVTEPYWLSVPNDDALYPIPNDSLIGLPMSPNNLIATFRLSIGNESFEISVPLSFKKLDPLKGDVTEALRIVPKLSFDFENPLLVTQKDGSLAFRMRLHAAQNVVNASIIFRSENWSKTLSGISLKAGIDTLIPIKLTPEEVKKAVAEIFYLTATMLSENKKESFNKSQHIISYDHLPTLQYFTQPFVKVLHRDWKVTAQRIGYVEGSGDNIPDVLRQCGLQVDLLNSGDLANAENLRKYDAILVGARAVNTKKEMKYQLPVLLNYAAQGGTLIMQYNTLQDLATTDLGPYPFTLSSLRVTEENAPITFLKPEHRLLNHPNKITEKDFQNWVQERGLYFPKEWDALYTPLFSTHDTDEKPLEGAMLYAPYGKGQYIYTSMSFLRQLPAGNRGAIRLMMNMLSVGK